MKKLIAILLMTISGCVFADVKPDPVFGDLTAIVKIGGWPGDNESSAAGTTSALTIAVETGTCNRYVHCFNPFVVLLSNNTGKNTGVGIDYVFKVLKRSYDSFYLAAGVVNFQNPLNHTDAERINLHVGAGVEIEGFVLSVDAYGTPNNTSPGETTFLVNTGWHF